MASLNFIVLLLLLLRSGVAQTPLGVTTATYAQLSFSCASQMKGTMVVHRCIFQGSGYPTDWLNMWTICQAAGNSTPTYTITKAEYALWAPYPCSPGYALVSPFFDLNPTPNPNLNAWYTTDWNYIYWVSDNIPTPDIMYLRSETSALDNLQTWDGYQPTSDNEGLACSSGMGNCGRADLCTWTTNSGGVLCELKASTVNWIGYQSTCLNYNNALTTTPPATTNLAACLQLCMGYKWCRSVDWCSAPTASCPGAGQPECNGTCNLKAWRAGDNLAAYTTASATCHHYDEIVTIPTQCPAIFSNTTGYWWQTYAGYWAFDFTNAPAGPYYANDIWTFQCLANTAVPPPYNTETLAYTCQSTQAWDKTFQPCLPVCSPTPTAPTNGSVAIVGSQSTPLSGGWFAGTMATFSCYPCFQLAAGSQAVVNCSQTAVQAAQWTSAFPTTCQQLQCSNIFDATGTASPTTFWSNSSVVFTCLPNYVVTSTDSTSVTYSCNCAGQWVQTFQSCQATCSVPSAPANGSVTLTGGTSAVLGGRPLNGTAASFACNPGQWLSGTTPSICLNTGQWSNAFPVCQPVNCTNVFDTTGTASATIFIAGSTYTFTCNPNYVLSQTNTLSATYTCTNAGTWSAAFVSCTATCAIIPLTTPNGQLTQTGTTSAVLGGRPLAGDTISLTCNAGYTISSQSQSPITCGPTGQWSAPAPVCVVANCPNIFDSSGTPSPVPYVVYNLYTFTCNPNSVVQTTDAVVTTYNCSTGGQWTTPFQPCIETCPQKWPLMNGYITMSQNVSVTLNGRAFVGTTAYITCNRGYVMNGVSQVICENGGQWSTAFPTCMRTSTTASPAVVTENVGCVGFWACWWWRWLLIGWATVATALLLGIWLVKKYLKKVLQPKTTQDKGT